MIKLKKRIIFIANPISGTQQKQKIIPLIKAHLSQDDFEYAIVHTEAAGHASELAADAVNMGYDVAVAIGGDGTVNEVAKSLINKTTALGIIPAGSGNGFARHLGLSMNPKDAIYQIAQMNIQSVDTAFLNQNPFFCTAGIGFDAHVSHEFAKQTKRGFFTYASVAQQLFKRFQPQVYELQVDMNKIQKEAFMITLANAAQFGNNAFIAPQASVQDGLLDVCIVKPFKPMDRFLLAMSLFNKTLHKLPFVEFYKAKSVEIKSSSKMLLHLDGEPRHGDTNVSFGIKPNSLRVLVGLPKAL